MSGFLYPKPQQQQRGRIMAESFQVATSSLCNLNGSHRRPIPLSRFMASGPGFRSHHSLYFTRSSSSPFFGTNANSISFASPRVARTRRSFSVFAMATEGMYLFHSTFLCFIIFILHVFVSICEFKLVRFLEILLNNCMV